ncbi:hypothetical protein IGI39_003876 [Enterococcus sp. AZ135]|uniref:hypothetical protein n=1 Tax=unclassified Enterococcus TaxID=2608891 RepID=UPI003F1EB999
MSATRFNQLLEAYDVADQPEKIQLITDEISAPEDFKEYLENSEENPEFYKSLFKSLGKNFIKTLMLFVMRDFDCAKSEDILDTKASDGLLNLLKDYIKTLDFAVRSELFEDVNEYQLLPRDIS